MSLFKRRILATIFILLFFVLTPPLLLYTAGYRWNTAKNRIERTGLLVVKSQPKRAAITIDGVLQNDETDTLIDTLLPNNYKVTVEKDGYHPWHQEIRIQPTLSSFLDDIILFKNTPPETLTQNILQVATTSNSEAVFFTAIDNDSITLYTSKSDSSDTQKLTENIAENHTVTSLENSIRIIEFKPLSTVITDYSSQNGLETGKTVLVNQVRPESFVMNEKYTLYLVGNTMFNAHTHTNTQHPTVLFTFQETPLAMILVNETLIYAVPAPDNRIILASRNISEPSKEKVLTALRTSTDITLSTLNQDNNVLLYTDLSQNILYALNSDNGDIIDVFNDAKHMSQNEAGKLLYHTDFEIWLLDAIGAEEKKLITRLSDPIQNIYWHLSGRYILYATKSAIFSQHITTEANKNTTLLIENADIKKSIHNASNNIIYFIDGDELKQKKY